MMNTILERVKHNFSESIQTKINAADAILPSVSIACDRILQCLLDGNKVMSCGNGGSACEALHFASEMLNRYKHERPSLPAIALNADMATLSSIANDYHFNEVFAKQIRALGQPNDVLVVLSTSGNSINILNAVKAAHDRDMKIIALTGHDGGKIPSLLKDTDLEVRVPAYDTSRIQETHMLILHCICDMVDFQLFGHGENAT